CASVSQPIAAPTALHSFPTRRSSDLAPVPHRRACPDPRARRGSTHLRGGAPRGGGNGPAAGAGRGPDPGDRPAAEHPPGAAPEVAVNRHPYATLGPDQVLDAVESLGFVSDARVLALNSYENRVYQVGIEDREPLIAKFYRPQRWSDAAIREEHAFTFELAEAEVPVVAPLRLDGESLFEHGGFRFALFPRRG